MKDIIESALSSKNVSEVEIAEWVTNLKRYHDEETRRQEERLEVQRALETSHNLAVKNFQIAQQNLEREYQRLAKERANLSQLVEGLAKERDAQVSARVRMEQRIKELEPDYGTKVLFAFGGGMAALLLLQLLWFLADILPGIWAWVRGLF